MMYIMMYMARKQANRRMIRKQVYIYPRQEVQLKRVAESREVTEAEIMRDALEAVLGNAAPVARTFQPDDEAWRKLQKAMRESRKRTAGAGKAHRWTREDYYDDPRYQRPWSK